MICKDHTSMDNVKCQKGHLLSFFKNNVIVIIDGKDVLNIKDLFMTVSEYC